MRIISLETGKQIASAELGGNLGASPAYSDGCVFVGSMDGHYAAVRVSDGAVMWQVEARKNGGASYGSAAVYGDAVVFGSRNKTVFRLARGTGRSVWTFDAGGQVDSSPVMCCYVVFFGTDEGKVFGLDLATGKPIWQFNAGSSITASPAIAYQRMVIGTTDGAIYCFG